jgi:ABC-type lipoprotein release transport system permease subunit
VTFLRLFVLILAGLGAAEARAEPDEFPTILVSRQLLESQHLNVGDVVQLSVDSTGTGAKSFRIVGTYEPTPDPLRLTSERREARMHLPDLLELTADPADPLSMDSVSTINVTLTNPSEADKFSSDAAPRMPGLMVRPTAPSDERSRPFVVLERFHQAIAIVTIIGSAIFLLALMVMLADERREAVGILRLIGLSGKRVLAQVFVEGILIAVSGAAFGILFALATQGLFNRFFQWRYDTTLVFLRVTPSVALQSVLFAVPLGVLASLVASYKLFRPDILSLIRR